MIQTRSNNPIKLIRSSSLIVCNEAGNDVNVHTTPTHECSSRQMTWLRTFSHNLKTCLENSSSCYRVAKINKRLFGDILGDGWWVYCLVGSSTTLKCDFLSRPSRVYRQLNTVNNLEDKLWSVYFSHVNKKNLRISIKKSTMSPRSKQVYKWFIASSTSNRDSKRHVKINWRLALRLNNRAMTLFALLFTSKGIPGNYLITCLNTRC